MKKCNFGHLKKQCYVHKRGSSSFKMHDPKKIFEEFNIKRGNYVLDLCCGPGDYTIECAKLVRKEGLVYALDIQKQLLDDLNKRAEDIGIKNIKTIACDITNFLPIEDGCIDVCIIVTALHVPSISKKRGKLFDEVNRVLKPGGRPITIDVKKDDLSFGPPLHMRISSEEMEECVIRHGFDKVKLSDLGYTYSIQFKVKK